jgi:hypothetical protein
MKKKKKEPWRVPSGIYLFTFESFAICFFCAFWFLGAVESYEDRFSAAFVLFCPVGAGVNFTNYVFCHEGSPPLIVIDSIIQ